MNAIGSSPPKPPADPQPSTTGRVVSLSLTTLACAGLGFGAVEGIEMLVPPGYAGCFPIPPKLPLDLKLAAAAAAGAGGALGWLIDAGLEKLRMGQRAALQP